MSNYYDENHKMHQWIRKIAAAIKKGNIARRDTIVYDALSNFKVSERSVNKAIDMMVIVENFQEDYGSGTISKGEGNE